MYKLLIILLSLYSCSKDKSDNILVVKQDGIHIMDYHYTECIAQSVPCADDRWYTFIGSVNGVADLTIDFIIDTLQTNKQYTIYINKWIGTGWRSDSATITNIQYNNSILNCDVKNMGYIKNLRIYNHY
jgi:hypothetical protein